MNSKLDRYCKLWGLTEPSLIFPSPRGAIYKVCYKNNLAALKIFSEAGKESESLGAQALRCFNGRGAVQIFEFDPEAHLLEYIDGPSLKDLVLTQGDSQATLILAETVQRLHSYSGPFPLELLSMKIHFESLFKKAIRESSDSIYVEGAKLAQHLLETERDVRLLHGDIHHENIRKNSSRGWLAFDPKFLQGERAYDVANVFFNPQGSSFIADLEVIQRRSLILSDYLKIDRQRLLQYAFVHGCLRAAWFIEDGVCEKSSLVIVENIRQVLCRLDS